MWILEDPKRKYKIDEAQAERLVLRMSPWYGPKKAWRMMEYWKENGVKIQVNPWNKLYWINDNDT